MHVQIRESLINVSTSTEIIRVEGSEVRSSEINRVGASKGGWSSELAKLDELAKLGYCCSSGFSVEFEPFNCQEVVWLIPHPTEWRFQLDHNLHVTDIFRGRHSILIWVEIVVQCCYLPLKSSIVLFWDQCRRKIPILYCQLIQVLVRQGHMPAEVDTTVLRQRLVDFFTSLDQRFVSFSKVLVYFVKTTVEVILLLLLLLFVLFLFLNSRKNKFVLFLVVHW